MWEVFIWVGVLVVVVLVAILRRREREAWERVVREMGFSLQAEPASWEAKAFNQLPLLKGLGVSTATRGQVEIGEMVVFNIEQGTGDDRVDMTVVLYRLARKQLPAFELRPEHGFDKLAALLGTEDINFDANPEFSSRYHLKGQDAAAVRALFSEECLRFFEQHNGWNVQGSGEFLLVYHYMTRAQSGTLRGFLEENGRVAAMFA